MPQITSVIVEDGALSGDVVREEYCSCENCGIRDDAVGIIIGGIEARVGSWPWNAAIYFKSSVTNLMFRCGATIINKRTLITTATCLFTAGKQINPQKLVIAAKENNLYGASSKKLSIQEIKIHENFTQDEVVGKLKYDYNVALLITEVEIPFSLHVNAICLPQSTVFNFDGKQGIVIGWGFNKNFELNQKLHELEGLR